MARKSVALSESVGDSPGRPLCAGPLTVERSIAEWVSELIRIEFLRPVSFEDYVADSGFGLATVVVEARMEAVQVSCGSFINQFLIQGDLEHVGISTDRNVIP